MNVQTAHKSTNYLKQGLWEYVIRESDSPSRPNNDSDPSFDVPPSKVVPPRFLTGKATATNKVAADVAATAPPLSHHSSPVASHIICHPSTLHRPANSSDSIGNEMTHFKPIRLMPISDAQPNGGDADAVAGTTTVLHAPKVRYVKTAETLFAPAKSKFKPETPQKVRKSAFCLVPKATPSSDQLLSATAGVVVVSTSTTTATTTTTSSNNHHHNHRTTTTPPSKPNTRKSAAAATNGSGGSNSSRTSGGNSKPATASTSVTNEPPPPPPPPTSVVHSYSVQYTNKSKQKLMCNIALDQGHRERILQQERGDFELAKMLQQFDAQPRVTRPGKAAAAVPSSAEPPAKMAKTRSSMSAVQQQPKQAQHGSVVTRRKHHSTSSVAAIIPTAASNRVDADTSPKRYFLRTRGKANGDSVAVVEPVETTTNAPIANGRARVKRTASGKRKANGGR